MNDWEDLEEEAKELASSKGPRCGIAVLLGDIAEEFGTNACDSVVRTLANHRLTSTSIRKALAARMTEGIDLPSVYSIQRHRTRRCSCKGDVG